MIQPSNLIHRPRFALGIILLVGATATFPLWGSGDIVYSDRSDILAEHVGVKSVIRRSVLEDGRLPVWNPSLNGGAPALANPQAMVFFPLDLLFLVLPLERATNLVLSLLILGAGLSMFLFCRRKLDSPVAALFGALATMLSYRLLIMIDAGWLPKMAMVALTPLLFWAADRVLERAELGRVGLFAAVMGLCFLQGDPQQLYYALVGLSVYCLWQMARVGFDGAGPRASGLVGGVILGAMLAAPALLPTLELAGLSTRTANHPDFFFFTRATGRDLWTMLGPADQGGQRTEYWENNFYFGIALYPLLLAALLVRRRLLWAMAGGVILCSLAFDTPLTRFLFEFLPGFSLFRIPGRVLFLAQFLWVYLAAAVLAALLKTRLLTRPCPARSIIIGLALVVPIVDAGVRVWPRWETRPLAEVFPFSPWMGNLQRLPGHGRVIATGRTCLPYGSAGYYGIDLVNGYASLNLRSFVDYFWVMQKGDRSLIPRGPQVWTDFTGLARPDLLAHLDVQHVLSEEELPFAAIGYEEVLREESVPVYDLYHGMDDFPLRIYRRTEGSRPGFFATALTSVRSRSRSLDALVENTSPTEASVWGLAEERVPTHLGPGTITTRVREQNRMTYDVHSPEGGYLVLSQVWYPGWKATLNGEPLPLYRTQHALLGCVIPPGEHELSLWMDAPGVRRGMMLSGFALVWMLCGWVLGKIVVRASGRHQSVVEES